MSEKSGGEFFFGFLIGALAGAAAALLMAPSSGEEVRRQLGERASTLKTQAEQLAEEARTQAQHLVEEMRSQTEHLEERGRIVLSEKVKQAQEAVQAAQARLGAEAQ